MDKTDILSQAKILEEELILVSARMAKTDELDSMVDWLKYVLQNDSTLGKYFLIPADEEIRSALHTIISKNNSMGHPVISSIANRIATLLSGTVDLKKHTLTSSGIIITLKSFDHLASLIVKYRFGQEVQKSIDFVFQASQGKRLHLYKTHANEPDLRVILKTLQVDPSRTNVEAIGYFLKFLFDQLNANMMRSGYIQYARHAWWAFWQLFELGDENWLKENKNKIVKIFNDLCENTEYKYVGFDFTNIAPELNSEFYERIWVTIDMMRVFRYTKARSVFEASFFDKLTKEIESNLRMILLQGNDGSLRSIQCKLVFMYECIIHYNYIEVDQIIATRNLNVQSNYIGDYLYNDAVISAYSDIKENIISFLKKDIVWIKQPTTCMLVSGSAGQGKSELAIQIANEIMGLSNALGRHSKLYKFAIGKEIQSISDLNRIFEDLEKDKNVETVRIIFFDEIDKADNFDLFTPLLSQLENPVTTNNPLTYWIFAQSKYSSFSALKVYADSLEKKSLRDFLTRIQLGAIDLTDMKTSSIQKILSLIGHANVVKPNIEAISTNCIESLFLEPDINNNRDLIGLFTKKMVVEKGSILLKSERKSYSQDSLIKILIKSNA
jgi:hypothetical protein